MRLSLVLAALTIAIQALPAAAADQDTNGQASGPTMSCGSDPAMAMADPMMAGSMAMDGTMAPMSDGMMSDQSMGDSMMSGDSMMGMGADGMMQPAMGGDMSMGQMSMDGDMMMGQGMSDESMQGATGCSGR